MHKHHKTCYVDTLSPNLVKSAIGLLQHNVQKHSSPKSILRRLWSPASFQIMTWKQHTKDAATSKTTEFLKAWSWASLPTSLSFGVEYCSNKKHFTCVASSTHAILSVFVFLAKRKDLALLYLPVLCSGQPTLHAETQSRWICDTRFFHCGPYRYAPGNILSMLKVLGM